MALIKASHFKKGKIMNIEELSKMAKVIGNYSRDLEKELEKESAASVALPIITALLGLIAGGFGGWAGGSKWGKSELDEFIDFRRGMMEIDFMDQYMDSGSTYGLTGTGGRVNEPSLGAPAPAAPPSTSLSNGRTEGGVSADVQDALNRAKLTLSNLQTQ